MKNLCLKIAAWGLVPMVPLLITSAVIGFAVNFQPLYDYGFQRYDVGQTTGLPDAELIKAARGLIDYFNSDEDLIDVTVQRDGNPLRLFNDREIIHLKDVRALIRLDYFVFLASLVYTAVVVGIMLYRQEPRQLAASLFWGGILTLAIVLVQVAMASADFSTFWINFHLISFVNDFWLLDPRTDYLIMLFPEGFWRDVIIFVDAIILTLAITVTVMGWRNLKIPDRTGQHRD